MIPNRGGGGGWHYLAIKKLSALLRGISSKHHCGFDCLNCFDVFEAISKQTYFIRFFNVYNIFI